MDYQTVLSKIEGVETYIKENKDYIMHIEKYKYELNELKILSYIREVEKLLKEVDGLININKYQKARETLDSIGALLKIAERMAEEFGVSKYSEKFKELNNKKTSNENKLIDAMFFKSNISIETFPPELYGKYHPLDKLGDTHLSKVFKVARKSDGKVIALKISKENNIWMIKNEYEKLKKLCPHPYIVETYGYYEEPIPHIELEYIDEYKLDGKIIRSLDEHPKPIEENKLVELIIKIAKGLAHAHSKNITHKDIKPSNILLTKNFEPKIIDFNIAKYGHHSIVKGYTPQYATPEQIHGWKTDKRTDIYQLGLIFYEYLIGKNIGLELYKIVKNRGDYGSKLKEIINTQNMNYNYKPIFGKLLQLDKEKRYSSIDEFIEDLENLIDEKHHPKTYVSKNNDNSEFHTGIL